MNLTLVLYCHPYEKSFNHAELERVVNQLEASNVRYKVIDLYNEGFNPAYDKEELRLFHSGQTHDNQVKDYLNLLQKASSLIIITPIWWNDIPGMLKGFIDKVMKEGAGLSHTVSKTGVHGLLTNIDSVLLLTTSTSPTFYLRLFCGDGIKRIFVNGTLKQLGMQHIKWVNFGGITGSKETRRIKYLEKVSSFVQRY